MGMGVNGSCCSTDLNGCTDNVSKAKVTFKQSNFVNCMDPSKM